MPTGNESTTSSTSDTLLQELHALTELALDAQGVADFLVGLAAAKRREIEKRDQMNLPGVE